MMADDITTDGGSQGTGKDPAGAGASSDRDKHNEAILALEASGMKVVKATDAALMEDYRRVALSVKSGDLSKKLKKYDAYELAAAEKATADLSEVEKLTLASKTLTTDNERLTREVSMSSLMTGLLTKNLERLLPGAEKTAVFPDFIKPEFLEGWTGEGDVDEFLETALDKMETGQATLLRKYTPASDTPGSPTVSTAGGRRIATDSKDSPLVAATKWRNGVSRKKPD
jgi:hypothetical protein